MLKRSWQWRCRVPRPDGCLARVDLEAGSSQLFDDNVVGCFGVAVWDDNHHIVEEREHPGIRRQLLESCVNGLQRAGQPDCKKRWRQGTALVNSAARRNALANPTLTPIHVGRAAAQPATSCLT